MTERGGQTNPVRGATEGGVAGDIPAAVNREIYVAPTIDAERNKITTAIIPVACWRIDDVRFEFDSSFVRPETRDDIGQLKKLRDDHRTEIAPAQPNGKLVAVFPPLSIFGHADPTGSDDYNKTLSGRRAQAIYALLTRRTDLWEDLYAHPHGDDRWGLKSVQIMLTDLGLSKDGATDGTPDQATKIAVQNFQRAKGLQPDGDPGPQTRQKLFAAYMDALCGPDFVLDKRDFLARGEDSGGKGDYQGCSEFNPLFLFSQTEETEFAQPGNKQRRDAENSPNRRVMVLLFRPGGKVTASKWPCPRAKEAAGGCRKRFWSDGEKRRGSRLPQERRAFEKTQDTFACRFYDRLSNNSPCERTGKRVFASWDVSEVEPTDAEFAEGPPDDIPPPQNDKPSQPKNL